MTRRIPALITAAALVLAPLATPTAQAAAPRNSEGLNIPINATSADQGTFMGNLHITKFAALGGQPVALGTVTGTLTDENGVMTGIVRNVALPLVLPTPAAASDGQAAVAPQAICDILHLVLGPLDLNLLGLIVHLDTVVLDITADNAGGLLGALLCAIAGLLGGGSPLEQILNQLVNLLNQLLGILS
jgi:hypothetical protein